MVEEAKLVEAESKAVADKQPRFQPGAINIVSDAPGGYHGCRCVLFNASGGEDLADLINSWFEQHKDDGFNAVKFVPTSPDAVLVFFNRVLTPEELELQQTYGSVIADLVQKKLDEKVETERRAKEELQAKLSKTKEEQEVEAKELKRLAHLGRLCVQNHKKEKAK